MVHYTVSLPIATLMALLPAAGARTLPANHSLMLFVSPTAVFAFLGAALHDSLFTLHLGHTLTA